MAKVIIFSRTFPKYMKKGAWNQTHFVEKFWESIYLKKNEMCFEGYPEHLADIGVLKPGARGHVAPKHHTIRSGNRWKVGDKFSPRVWSGKPYASKQIIIAPDIEVKKVWDFEIKMNLFFINGIYLPTDRLGSIAKNDGLTIEDFWEWFKFPKPFKGQIICWSDEINY